jgi:hypothetical protein
MKSQFSDVNEWRFIKSSISEDVLLMIYHIFEEGVYPVHLEPDGVQE